MNNITEQLNKDLFEIKKNILDYKYTIEKDNNYIKHLEHIIHYLKNKLGKNMSIDEINEINEQVDSFLGL